MNINLADVTLHIDEALNAAQRGAIEDQIRAMTGVVSVHNPDKTPHLTMVEYDPQAQKSDAILATVRSRGVHAEMIGL